MKKDSVVRDGSRSALLLAAQAGDRPALETLLQQEERRIYAFGLKLCRNREDAQDILQDTLLAVARHIGSFRGESTLPTWLFQIARSYCIKKRRRKKGAPRTSERLSELSEQQLADSALTPEQTIRGRELEAIFNAALQSLSPGSRQIIVLRDVEGLSAKEAAEVLGLSVEAVKSKLHRARASLGVALTRAPRLVSGA